MSHGLRGVVRMLLVLICALIFSSCGAQKQMAYEKARAEDTSVAWERFLEAYPRGQLALDAHAALEQALLRDAQQPGLGVSELEEIKRRCASVAIQREIQTIIFDAAWQDVEASPDIVMSQNYVEQYPDSPHHSAAKKKIQQLMWDRAAATGTAEAWASFIEQGVPDELITQAQEQHDQLLLAQARKAQSGEEAEILFKRCLTRKGSDALFLIWDEVAWKEACRLGEADSYGQYLIRFPSGKHTEEANQAREEVMWRACIESKRIEAYQFYLREYGKGKYSKEAALAMEKLVYERVREKDTIEAYENFLGGKAGYDEAKKRLRHLKYQRALGTDSLEEWKTFLATYNIGYRNQGDAELVQMRKHASRRNEQLLAASILRDPTLKQCFEYVSKNPSGTNMPAVLQVMEPLLYEKCLEQNNISSYEDYLERFSESTHASDILNRLDPLIFKEAQKEDWYLEYSKYLARFPNGFHAEEARNRFHYLTNTRGAFTIEFPEVVEGKSSPYSNVSSPFFGEWDTVIRETSGKIGFKARASGHIIDPSGGRWDPSRSIGKTPAGGTGKDDYWCSSPDHVLCNGYAVFTWIVEDAGGHTTTLYERVKLQHTNCPGPR